MKVLVGILAGVGTAGLFGVSSLQAADMLPPPPPPPQYEEASSGFTSCIYGRVDVGGSFHIRPDVNKVGGAPFGGSGTDSALDETIKEHGFVEAGVGCQFTDLFRVEVTGGYRMKASLTDPYATLNGNLETYTGFVNAFWDITNYRGFTPYVGFGVGAAYNRLSGFTLPATAGSGDRINFAFNGTAGISYDLSRHIKLDLAYRYIDLGVGITGGTTPVKVEDLRAHEVKLGMRFHFN